VLITIFKESIFFGCSLNHFCWKKAQADSEQYFTWLSKIETRTVYFIDTKEQK